MKIRLILLLRFISRFGLIQGTRLFIQFQVGKLDQIRIPNLVHPLRLRPETSDPKLFQQIFLEREYEVDFHNPSIIIDAGANIGLFALAMVIKYPQAKIICIEPDPENFELLVKNTQAYPQISCENAGLWNKSIRLKIYDKYDEGKWGMVVEEDPHEGTILALSMDDIFKKYQLSWVDLLKIDIETSEKQVFSEGFESWLPRIKMISIEIHDWMEPGCAQIFFKAIILIFKKFKYTLKGENTLVENLSFEEPAKI